MSVSVKNYILGFSVEYNSYAIVVFCVAFRVLILNLKSATITGLYYATIPRLLNNRNGPTKRNRIKREQQTPHIHFSHLLILSPNFLPKYPLFDIFAKYRSE